MPVRFGVSQGSVLGPTLFSSICNNLPNITNSGEVEIHMHGDDTTFCVAASSPDEVAALLNSILNEL